MSWKVGEAPWEAQESSSFKVGEAPWEKEAPKADNPGEAAIQGFGKGIPVIGTYLPHLQAATMKGIGEAHDLFADENHKWLNPDDTYTKLRDEMIKRDDKLYDDNPVSYGAGYAGGLVSGSIASSGLINKGLEKMGIKAAEKGAPLLDKMISGAKGGAATGVAMGALSNPGDVEGELSPLQLEDRGKNAAIAGLMGGVLSGVAPAIGEGIKKVGNSIKDKAERLAYKSMGPYAREAIKDTARDQISSTGRALLDEGVVGGKPTSYEGLSDRAEAALNKKGAEIGQYMDDLSAAEKKLTDGVPGIVPSGTEVGPTQAGVSRKAVADKLREQLINPNTEIPGVAAKNKAVEAMISNFENGGDDLIPILKSEELKRSIGKEIKWDRLPNADIPLEEQVNRGLYNNMRQGVEDAAQFLEDKVGGPDVGKFQKLKSDYGALERGVNMSTKRAAKDSVNRFLSPTDYLTGGIGAAGGFASGDGIEDRLKKAAMGFSLGLANKGARLYGNQLIAPALDKVSKVLLQSPKFADLAAKNPEMFMGIVNSLVNKPKFKSILQKEDNKNRQSGIDGN